MLSAQFMLILLRRIFVPPQLFTSIALRIDSRQLLAILATLFTILVEGLDGHPLDSRR